VFSGSAVIEFHGTMAEVEDLMSREMAQVSGLSFTFPAPAGSPIPGATGANFGIRVSVPVNNEPFALDLKTWSLFGKTWTLSVIHALLFINKGEDLLYVRADHTPDPDLAWNEWIFAGTLIIPPGGFSGMGNIATPGMPIGVRHYLQLVTETHQGSNVEVFVIGTGTYV